MVALQWVEVGSRRAHLEQGRAAAVVHASEQKLLVGRMIPWSGSSISSCGASCTRQARPLHDKLQQGLSWQPN